MSSRHIEKNFLYLLAASIVLHLALFAALVLLPQSRKVTMPEPYMVELSDLPELKHVPPAEDKDVRRLAEKRQRVARQTAPKGETELEKQAALQKTSPPPVPGAAARRNGESVPGRQPVPQGRGELPPREFAPGEGVLKRRESQPDLNKLLPGANRLAKLEEVYRKKYGTDVEDGDTKFLDTNDFLFGSFLRRFETAIYGVWQYPQDAAKLGVEGITVVKITFNNRGEIEAWKILQSSKSAMLDNEVERTLRRIGPIGSFPKGYQKDQFHLIAFFHYGILQGAGRGMLR